MLSDIPSLREQILDLAGFAPDGSQGEVNRDGQAAGLIAEDVHLVTDKLAGGGAPDGSLEVLLDLFGDLPPAGGPKGLAADFFNLVSCALEGGAIHFDVIAFGVQEGDKLAHAVQDDRGQALMFLDLGRSVVKRVPPNASTTTRHGFPSGYLWCW
jgi:hypothetical protein